MASSPYTPAPAATQRWLALLHVAVAGLYFGTLQWGAFFLLQSYLASTAIIYLLATAVWMSGGIVGLVLPGRGHERLWILASIASYAALRLVAVAHPYDFAWLPVLLAFVAVMGAYAGRFFRCRAETPLETGGTDRLFLVENTGFVAGLFLTVGLLYSHGDRVLLVLPVASALLCLLTLAARSAAASTREQPAASRSNSAEFLFPREPADGTGTAPRATPADRPSVLAASGN